MSEPNREGFQIGTDVLIGNDIHARIRAIEIRGPQRLISYQCVWWDERKLNSEWVYSDEIKLPEKQNSRAGFKS